MRARNAGSIEMTCLEGAVHRARLLHDDAPVALDDAARGSHRACPLMSLVQSASPLRISARASFTQRGHRLSVSRGQPSGGVVRSPPLGIGLSLHFG